MTSIAERVARGAAWLDENWPNWLLQIDLDRLDMHSCSRCVFGQTMGDYCDAPDEITDPEFGFATANEGHDLAALEAEWRRVITSRREATRDA